MAEAASRSTVTRGRFLWGAILAWVPILIIVVPGLMEIFRGITNQKATGLGAVAGGLSEAFVTFGIVAFVTAQVTAIVLLVRSVGMGGTVQNFFAIFSIGLSVVTLVATGLLLWLILFIIPRLHSR